MLHHAERERLSRERPASDDSARSQDDEVIRRGTEESAEECATERDQEEPARTEQIAQAGQNRASRRPDDQSAGDDPRRRRIVDAVVGRDPRSERKNHRLLRVDDDTGDAERQ